MKNQSQGDAPAEGEAGTDAGATDAEFTEKTEEEK